MPTVYKAPGGRWRAQIKRKGKTSSKMFNSKSAATEWAYKEEKKILEPEYAGNFVTLSDALEKYNKEESIHKPSYSRECKRTEFLKKFELTKMPIASINEMHINSFIVERLKEVKRSTVIRDLSFLGVVFEAARKKWKFITSNPVHEADKPKPVKARSQRMTQEEIDSIVKKLGFEDGKPVDTSYRQVAVILLLAIETAMRQSEIVYLTWEQISDRSAYLPTTKNGEARTVPLSLRAVELIEMLPRKRKRLFTVTPATVSTIFRRIRRKLGYHHLRFHDSRREATSRLAKKFNVMMLSKITGHKDLKVLNDVYYAPELDDFLSILDG